MRAAAPLVEPARPLALAVGPMNLADLYDADRRVTDPAVARVARVQRIPHPLHGVPYADGTDLCTHAKRCTTPTGERAAR